MNQLFSMSTPLQNMLIQNENSHIKQAVIVLAAAALLAVASQISIPMQPIPLTFQSATVALIGIALGAKRGTYAIATYLVAGICGLPVFANFTFGPSVLFGPSAGYLIGFLPGAFVAGYLAEHGFARHVISSLAAALTAAICIFSLGVCVLATMTGWHNAVALGLMPFILSEPFKLLAVAAVAPRFWKKDE
jgi:biotin transport system substrate-specific component